MPELYGLTINNFVVSFFEKSSRGNHHLREKSGSGISTVPLQIMPKYICQPTGTFVIFEWQQEV